MADHGETPIENEEMSDITIEDAPLDITHRYIKDLSFENPQSPRFIVEADATPEIAIHINAKSKPIGDRRFEVTLLLEANARYNEEVVFVAELHYSGHVVIGDVDDEHIQPLLLIEAPRLLFPFARQILSDTVRNGGFPPLLLNPVDFMDIYAQGTTVTDEDEQTD